MNQNDLDKAARVGEFLYMHGAKMGRAGCMALAPSVVAKVEGGISTDGLARYLYENAGTPNLKSAGSIATAIIGMVGRDEPGQKPVDIGG